MSTELAREALRRVHAERTPTVVTIGVFDGVHRGHRQTIGRMIDVALSEHCLGIAVTFYPHPRQVLHPETPVKYLCGIEERIRLIEEIGVDKVAVVPFTAQLSLMPARDFTKMLADELNMAYLVVGPDFVLGHDREGSVEVLSTFGEEMSFQVETVPLLIEDGEKVGSSTIRAALTAGDVAKASRLLGRPFSLRGLVVRGAERGRTIGFPTANIDVGADQALPAFGVYVTKAYIDGARYKAVTNIGIRPTFSEVRPTVETYILDFDGDLYDKEVRIDLIDRLREEKRFGGVEELVAQIHIDIEATRKAFA
jgi:riboflavin kinase/FMN adenylyltransferase